MKAPFLYQYIHSKLVEHSRKGIIKMWEFRGIIGRTMRIKKTYSTIILKELEGMELVRYDKEKEVIYVK